MTTRRFKGEVIEIYPGEGKAAVRFSFRGQDRVETVKRFVGPDALELKVGMKGWASYVVSENWTGVWGFEPFKDAERFYLKWGPDESDSEAALAVNASNEELLVVAGRDQTGKDSFTWEIVNEAGEILAHGREKTLSRAKRSAESALFQFPGFFQRPI